ncbi:POK19 protein, partial [Erythrocercus mccallii]|nr:POK19 protein [Erythrocercus mccallii]
PRKRYHWQVLPQGMKNSPMICQRYIASLLSPVCAAMPEVVIHHYMDDVLVCVEKEDLLKHSLDLMVKALTAAGFKLQESKIQRMPPWKYLGLEISWRTIVPQKFAIKTKIETLADVHQLCGALTWVRPWLGLSTKDLAPLFSLLKGAEELSSPRTLTPEARAALEKVQDLMVSRQAHRCVSGLPFRFIILGDLPYLHGIIFQWVLKEIDTHTDRGKRDPLMIIEDLAGCDFECIHIGIRMKLGQISKATLDHLLQTNEALQFALYSYPGKISLTRPAHKLFNQDAQFVWNLDEVQSKKSLKALTVFTDASGGPKKSILTWKDPKTLQWESEVLEIEGSPQVAELAAVVRAFERFPEPLNIVTDSAYVAGVVSHAENAILQEVSNELLFDLLAELVKLISQRKQPYYVMHTRSHTDLPGFIANRRADVLAAPVVISPLPDIFEWAQISHHLHHQNVPGLVKRFHLTRDQAKAIVASCPQCSQHAVPTIASGVNPQGLASCELWQCDVTHFSPFGRMKYIHVSVDTFSGAVFASAHTGETTLDAIWHPVLAFATLGIPREIKTDNGPAYTSKEFRAFLQQWGLEHKTLIPHSPTGQAVVERTHCDLKRVLNQQ